MGSLPVADPKLAIYDCGNVSPGNLSLTQAQEALGKAIERMHELGLQPLVLGGGHETSLGHYLDILRVSRKKGSGS